MSQGGTFGLTRRECIAATCAVTLGSLTGCVGGDGDGGDGSDGGESDDDNTIPDYEVDSDAPARLKILSVTFEDDPTYGDTFEGEVTFANTGGEPIEGNAQVGLEYISTADVDTQTAELNSDELASGDQLTHSIGAFEAVGAGEFRLVTGDGVNSVHEDVEEIVEVAPRVVDFGERVELPNDVRVTVDEIEYAQSLLDVEVEPQFGDDVELVSVRDTLDDRILVIASVTVENATGNAISVDPGRIQILDGNPVEVSAPTLDNSPIAGQNVNPGEATEGWLGAAVDISDLGGPQIGIHTLTTEGDPDIVIETEEDPDLPQFEIADADVPSTRQPGRETYQIEVENVGNAIGTYRGTVEYRWESQEELEDASDFGITTREAGVWNKWIWKLTAEIPPGETRTVEFSSESELTVSYRIQPSGYMFTVEQS